MEIVKVSRELTPQEKFKMTKGQGTQKMKDLVDQVVEFDCYCIYNDTDVDGKPQTLQAFLTPEGETIATNSSTFQRDFLEMLDFMSAEGVDVKSFKVVGGESKAGRHFITCTLA